MPEDIEIFTDEKMELLMLIEAVIDDEFKNINLRKLLKNPTRTLRELYPHLGYAELYAVADDAYTLGRKLARKAKE